MSGSGDYISRNAAIEAMYKDAEAHPDHTFWTSQFEALIDIPAADVRPVVKATWKRVDYKPCGHDYECSSCGWKNDMETHYCPNCGADMRAEEGE